MNVVLKLKEKYKTIPVAAKVSIWFALCSIFQKGISFITVPLFTRLMTTEQYGQFSVYQSWHSIIAIFATLNLSYGVFNNGMTKYPDDRDRYISSMQGLSTIVTMALLTIYLPLQGYINDLTGLSTILMLLMFADFLTAPALAFWSAKQRYEFKYVALVAITLGMSVISPMIGLIAVVNSSKKGIARIVTFTLVNICVGMFFYIFNAIKGKKFFVKKYWSFALRFNIPLIPHYLSAIVLAQSDKVMIEHFFGETEVAIYSVAYSLSLLMNIVTNSINSSYVPWTYQKLNENNTVALKKTTNLLLLGIAAVSILPVMLAPELMWIIAPPEYMEAIWVIPPISTSVYFVFLYSLFGNIEFYFEKNKFVMIASSVGAILNIVLNALLMPIFGYIAAGYTTMFCYMLFAIVHYIFMRKVSKEKLGITSVYNDKLIVLITVIYLACNVIAICLYNLVIIRYIILLVAFAVVIIKRKTITTWIANFKKR